MLYVATVIWFNHSLIQPSSAWVQEIVILLKSSVITELFSGKRGGGGERACQLLAVLRCWTLIRNFDSCGFYYTGKELVLAHLLTGCERSVAHAHWKNFLDYQTSWFH